jgi:hypothetical protein
MGKPESNEGVSPIDTNWNCLFDTAYAHPKLRTSGLQWQFYNYWNKTVWTMLNSTRYGYGQHAGIKKGYHISEGRSLLFCLPDGLNCETNNISSHLRQIHQGAAILQQKIHQRQ